MKSRILLLITALALALAGCKSQGVDSSGKPIAATSPTTASDQTEKPPQDKPLPPVPEDLKSEAYHWYGLNNLKPMKIQIDITGQPSTTGDQTVRLTDVKDGKATFEIDRPGQLGTETISLEKDGVYTVGSSLIEGSTRNLEMPASIAPGSTWKNTGKVQMSQEVDQNLTIKAVGVVDVDTKAGKQSALRIRQDGTLAFGGKTYRMESDLYYVKDKGLVKSVATMKDSKNPKDKGRVITIQETK